MRFTHSADCHVGGHRDPRLRVLTEQAFQCFINESLAEMVDFIIIAGDLFNTAIPGIDTLKFVVTQLNKAKQQNTPVYVIPGSHDFSPSGKTMIDVLEEAQLLTNVCRGTVTEQGKLKLSFTEDKKTGVKLTGVIGKRGMLDRTIYEDLDHGISNEPGKKIFLFHTAITELKPTHLEEMESYPVSFLPQGFDYYAGGHVHIVERYQQDRYANIVYPGPLFPNSFSELERLQNGGYYLYDDGTLTRKDLKLKNVHAVKINVNNMSATAANAHMQETIASINPTNSIILLRIEGVLSAGNTADIDLRTAIQTLEQNGAYIVLRNTAKLTTKEFTEIAIQHTEPQQIEELLLKEHATQLFLEGADGAALTTYLLSILSKDPKDGEKIHEYQEHIIKDALEHIDNTRQ